ncbi:hypothetical protein [Siphonobacter sp. SORGH_AS_0500]|uniref:hypothetical protein n=1 Tax=Siphonobacter sp. SORGH_AS_0500 TaxID=1864824 RepID=UPI0028654C07|nr:hypothetical protein [Siphonobacter sp. SORGH_AS_0500]MDR6193991.1 hypothetical protein [Siphonobacter sp. SORGH_AS_0500]
MLAISKDTNSFKWVIVLSIIPILLFFYTFFSYVSNIPFQDDYDALLEPVTAFKNMPHFSWNEFVKIIWTQDDERRIVLDRVIALLIYAVHGSLDLRIQMFVGLLSIIGLLYFFYTIIKGAQLPAILLLCCALLLFHIQYYEAIFWGMIPLQHIIVYFFAIGTFYNLYSPTPVRIITAVLMGILAIFSDVSGTFVLPAGIAVLILQRQWKYVAIWVIAMGAMIWLYYHNLEIPAYRPKLSDNLAHPKLIIYNFLAFSGISADANTLFAHTNRVTLILFTGMILWGVLFYYAFLLLKHSFFSHDIYVFPRWKITLWGSIIHLSIIIIAFAVGRAMDGPEAVLISRYKHIGFIWLILISILVFTHLKSNYIQLGSKIWLGISLCIFGFSYFEYLAPLDFYYKERNTDIYGWQHNRALPSSPIYVSLKSAVDTITEQAIASGIYQLPEPYFFDQPYQVDSSRFPLNVDYNDSILSFHNETYTRNTGKNDGAYIVLKSATQNHIIPGRQKRFSLKSYLFSMGNKYYANGFTGSFSAAYLSPDQVYDIYIVTIEGHKKLVHPTKYQISNINSQISVKEI